jgi:sugar phosphate isomerase/epimerase
VATNRPTKPQVGLGLLSLALGTAPLVAPDAVARAAGLRRRPVVLNLLRAVGVRELVVGTGLLVRRTPTWVWARVAQDAMDVPLAVVTTAAKEGEERARMTRVTAFLVAVTVVDLAAAIWATRTKAGADAGR